ncbi:ferritin-like domain-containing protein [Pseudogulbenkiania sp. MAI-1]|uniref:ferritin-like domain-containing protein n=1 Tax=Pseudogulbenkiania sp. MAI-1 TaxID=990370 RepID=UPI00045E9181|nr:ferritin-like domain-containing protein [Pseudogulbenkiania sp. MAI-1]
MQRPASMASTWNLDRIPLESIDLQQVRCREDLFYLATAASFIESGSDLYTRNLIRYCTGETELVDWLQNRWEPEEMRHGRALSAYVRHVWPKFDWERAFAAFFEDYSRQCTLDEFEPTPGLEMAARCVIETGTATFYQALAEHAAEEPVLAGLASRIRADEIDHYKHFYRYFRQYRAGQPPGRLRVLTALGRRVLEARRGDAECALWHAFTVRQPEAASDKASFQALNARLGQQLKRHYPVTMAVKMLLKPLDLPTALTRAVQGPLIRAARWALR